MAHYWKVDGKYLNEQEYEEYLRQEEETKERVRQETAALMKRLGEDYTALTRLLEQNPEISRKVSDTEAVHEEIYQKLRRGLERADEAPRCRWIKEDGTICGSPQMRGHIYCYAHKRMMESRATALRLPALEDANAIQMAVMRVQKALIDDQISEKKAGLLLYSLQIATVNLAKTTFGTTPDSEMVTEQVSEEMAFEEIAFEEMVHPPQSKSGELVHPQQSKSEERGREPRMDGNRIRVELPDPATSPKAASGSFDAPLLPSVARACSG